MKRLFHNTVFSGVDAVVLVALNILATPVLIRNLGVAEYGVFVFLSVFSTYGLLSFFDLGMEGSLLNYVARFDAQGNRDAIQDTLSISLVYYGAIGLVLGVGLYLASGIITSRFADDAVTLNWDSVILATRLTAANAFVQFLTLPLTAVLQGLRRYVVTKVLNSVLMILQYVILMLAALVYHRVDFALAVVLGITLVRLSALAVIVWWRKGHFRPMRFRLQWNLLKTLFSYSSILLISRVIGIIFNQMDKFLIWFYLAATHMSIYDIVIRPANLIRIAITTINSAIIPDVARLHANEDTAGIRRLYVNLVRYAYVATLPALAVLYGHMESFLNLWVGPELGQNYRLAWVILAAYFVSPIAAVASTMAVGLELVKKVLWISVVASIINIVLSVVLLKHFGLLGLLLGTLAAELFMVGPYLSKMMQILEMELGEIVRAISGSLLLTIPVVAAHLYTHYRFHDELGVWLPVAAVLTLVHLTLNYRFILSAGERTFLLARLGIISKRGEPEAEA